jgi:membrane-associated phospholipid phosphatase
MKGIVQIDHELTNRIRTWGQPAYGFWKWMAAQSIALFVIAALGFAIAEQLVFWEFAIAFITAYIIANIFQRLIRRSRPDFEKLTGYKMWIHTYSYPSAHAAMSAAAATALALFVDFPSSAVALVTTIGAVLLTSLIGVSRVVVGVHYCADVLFGWLLGFVVALGYVLLLVM